MTEETPATSRRSTTRSRSRRSGISSGRRAGSSPPTRPRRSRSSPSSSRRRTSPARCTSGHALNNSLQDAQIRFKKLQGFETLWLPGTDHASIGTHTHIDRALAAEGTDRFKLGREEFLKRAWAWKEKYGARIIEQLKLLGCACDWTRTRFTMDEMLSRAVREAFVRYYEDGLIYRGTRIVNWCPRCHTAVSDLEVKHQDQNSHWWYIRYPLADDGQGVQGFKGSRVQVRNLEPRNPRTLEPFPMSSSPRRGRRRCSATRRWR